MSRFDFTQRKDLILPCKGCPDRQPACQDHCRKPEYLEIQKNQEAMRRHRAFELEVKDYEHHAGARRRRNNK